MVTGATSITSTTFVGALTGNADTATNSTTSTLTDNEATAEANPIWFSAGAAGAGSIGAEADGDLTYNPSTGTVTATAFVGDISGGTGSLSLADGTISASVDTQFATLATISTLTEDELGGKWFFITDTGTGTLTLPALTESGHSACFYTTGALVLTIATAAADNEYLRLDGVQLGTPTKGWTIDSPGAAGDFICIIGQENGASDEWITLGRSGTWVDSGTN